MIACDTCADRVSLPIDKPFFCLPCANSIHSIESHEKHQNHILKRFIPSCIDCKLSFLDVADFAKFHEFPFLSKHKMFLKQDFIDGALDDERVGLVMDEQVGEKVGQEEGERFSQSFCQ